MHLWRVDLGGVFPEHLEHGVALGELERADRFKYEEDRRRYLRSGYALREILSRYLRIKPASIPIRASALGKPYLREHDVGQSIFFNLSHTKERAVVAVARARVGVDVEEAVEDYPYMEVADRYFAEGEAGALKGERDPARRADLFFRYWTRKEALLKASGEGMHGELKEADLSSPGPGVRYKGAEWTAVELEPEGKFYCCLVVEGRVSGVELYGWEPR